jgi:hypothetical protein
VFLTQCLYVLQILLSVLQVTVCDASSETQRALEVIRSSGVSQSLPARRESVARLGEKKEQMQRLRNRFVLFMYVCMHVLVCSWELVTTTGAPLSPEMGPETLGRAAAEARAKVIDQMNMYAKSAASSESVSVVASDECAHKQQLVEQRQRQSKTNGELARLHHVLIY